MAGKHPRHIRVPLDQETIDALRAGDQVLISGTLLTARDAAHQRLVAALERGEPLPIDLRGQVIYYVGPAPPRPGMVIGSAGPTTSGRMDPYTPALLAAGLRGMIGKGYRSLAVRQAIVEHGAVYFGAVGGSGALLARRITAAEILAYEDLGPEAIYQLTVVDFPAVVINDRYGGDLYETAPLAYAEPVDQS
ncbi:Fe-S-containing hydro-lyase [Thermomicrobiaceae bacterium CFH 74404]|uniref:Fe-S-containing hydro-lyase n=1 Tax=Thermalbibacter longus TaxID=2951981 RepID=A0AA42B9R7_9BACT|nr:Fe-S-containing hydro-lyase [Thermalbibacter longus]MCM8747599.1 Fe-S-containing hydro-lyase [Thermalbibacter longus]